MPEQPRGRDHVNSDHGSDRPPDVDEECHVQDGSLLVDANGALGAS